MKQNGPDGSQTPLAQLLETPEPLPPAAAVTVAAARLRETQLPALPVVQDGRLVGLVGERVLLAALPGERSGDRTTCAEIVAPATAVPLTTPVEEVLWLLRRDDVEVLAVVDATGVYQGVLSRGRLLEALENGRRPRLIGGLATPLGVHLTTVSHRGGVGDLPLFLTGLYFFGLSLLARGLVGLALALIAADPFRVALGHWSSALVQAGAVPAAGAGAQALILLVFLTLIRISPLAGYHSGEHQTVHALERGVPLVPEEVAAMPRPHPRCGTNLVVLLLLLAAVYDLIASGRTLWLPPALLALLTWRRLGTVVQRVFTTKPASRRQLEAGIAAGRMLLARYQRQPNYRAPWPTRLWNRGLAQVALGFAAGWYLAGQAAALLGWLILRSAG